MCSFEETQTAKSVISESKNISFHCLYIPVVSASLSEQALIHSYHLTAILYMVTQTYSMHTHKNAPNTRLGRFPFHSSELHLMLHLGTDRVRHLAASAAWHVCGTQRT